MIPALPFAHALVAKSGPADPRLALRLGGLDRPRRLLLRPLRRLAQAAVRGRTLAPLGRLAERGPALLAAAGPLRRARRPPARGRHLRRHPRHRSARPQLRDHLLLRHRLDRLPLRLGAVRQRLPDLQPVAGDRPGRGRRLRAPRPPAPGAPRLPGEARPLARRGRPARLRLAGGRLRLQRRRRGRARTARGGGRRLRLHRLHAGDDGALRHRGLVLARRDLLGLLRDVRDALPVRRQGRPHRPPPPARRRGALGRRGPRLDRGGDRLDRLDQLRRSRGRRLQIGPRTRRQVDLRRRRRAAGDDPHHRHAVHGGDRRSRSPGSTCSGSRGCARCPARPPSASCSAASPTP